MTFVLRLFKKNVLTAYRTIRTDKLKELPEVIKYNHLYFKRYGGDGFVSGNYIEADVKELED